MRFPWRSFAHREPHDLDRRDRRLPTTPGTHPPELGEPLTGEPGPPRPDRDRGNPDTRRDPGIRHRVLNDTVAEHAESFRFLVRDRDAKFTAVLDAVFGSVGIEVIRTPVRAPRANAYPERWIGTIRRECLDRLLIVNERHLRLMLEQYVEHFNSHRLYRSIAQRSPDRRHDAERPANVHSLHLVQRQGESSAGSSTSTTTSCRLNQDSNDRFRVGDRDNACCAPLVLRGSPGGRWPCLVPEDGDPS
jgi:hypothetical protein